MFISIHAAGMPFNGATIENGESLGGSESAAYFMAKELAAIGHTVTVFTTHQECGFWDNVRYEWIGEVTENAPLGVRFAFAMRAPQDVVIVQRHPRAFEVPPNSKLNIWWLHDLALHRQTPILQNSLVNTDLIFTVSEFHREQVSEVYGIDKRHIYATQNGVDYEKIKAAIEGVERKEKHLVFASRPERGLENLVRPGGIMELLPDYHLHVCGYDNTTPQMAGFYAQLMARINEMPNVTHHGHLGKSDLYKLLASCQAYVYPTLFEDTSNIMALESAACGTPFIGMHNAALPETCAGGFARLVPLEALEIDLGQVDSERFKDAIKIVCEKSYRGKSTWGGMHAAAKRKRQAWPDIARVWNDLFSIKIYEKGKDPYASIKALEYISDISAILELYDIEVVEQVLPDFADNYRFYLEDDFVAHYKAYYEYEKARGVEYGPESLDGNQRFEAIKSKVVKHKARSVLDYGCAHGHYIINLAKRMPKCSFVGVDLAQSNIDIANQWAKDEGLKNVEFWRSEHKSLLSVVENGFDLIIAAEVLEHVKSPAEVVDSLISHLNPGGTMLICVPYGPWEAIGYEKHKGWRAHIHHIERADLIDMFAHFDNYSCMAMPHSANLGHYIATFTKPEDDRMCGQVDFERKGKMIVPAQTLSACIIVKDGADDIGKCLRQLQSVADEIIVGVDESTTDNTIEVLEKYGVTYFEMPSVTGQDGIGFAEARNMVIENATCDWILWIDADETIENIGHLKHYLRPNPFDGYMVKQHHYSAEPPAILQTDLPCRFFRNHKDVQFFGMVHEHPSQSHDMNAGVGRTFELPNVHIMHTGYATEDKRRARFLRNFPLLKMDREINPGRILGMMLYVRDLAHCVKYEMEKSRGVVTQEAFHSARAAIALWKKLLTGYGDSHARYVIDSMQYYSECVKISTNGHGIPWQAEIMGTRLDGYFDGVETIKLLMEKFTESNVAIREKRYF